MRTNWKKKFFNLMEDLEITEKSIADEISFRYEQTGKPQVGKEGCLKRISRLIQFHKNPLDRKIKI